MKTEKLVRTFVEYFEERDHRRITGSTLLPPPGDSVLFTTSGMHPLTPYLEGRPHPLGRRLVNVRRRARVPDRGACRGSGSGHPDRAGAVRPRRPRLPAATG